MFRVATLALVVLAIVSANAFTQAQLKFQQEALEQHNQLRARNCVSPLELDPKLNAIAQAYAEKLAAENKFEHSGNGYGENLYMMSSSGPLTDLHGSKAAQAWYDEIKDYDFTKPDFSMATGHFTQVVWKNSKQLGVGVAFGNNGKTAVVVANYYPPGNYMGQFPDQVSRAQC